MGLLNVFILISPRLLYAHFHSCYCSQVASHYVGLPIKSQRVPYREGGFW